MISHGMYRFSAHRPIFVIGIITLLLSLVTPMLSLQATAAILDDADPCQAGFVVNEDTGGCELAQPPSDRQPLLQPTLPDRLVRPTAPPEPTDVPARPTAIPTEPPAECDDGFVLNPFTGACDPIRPTDVPVEATEVVVEPTEASVEPTQVIEPTREPEQSEPVGGSQEPDEPIEPEDGGATAEFTTWICPKESTLDPTSASPGELAKQCVESLPGVGLELLSNGEPFTRGATNDQGRLLVGDIPPGELTVIQHAPEGYVFGAVTTTVYPDGPNGEGLPPTIGIDPGPQTTTLDPDVWVDVDIFYFWGISISVETYWCQLPPSNGQHQSVETLVSDCSSTGLTTNLDLVGLNPGQPTGWETEIVPGTPGAITTWNGLSALEGPYEITEGSLDGTVWTSEVRCREQGNLTTPPSDKYVTQPNVGTASSFKIQLTTHVGLDWECKWFHFSDNSMWVHNYQCANAPTSTSTVSDVRASCNASPGLNEGFTLTTAAGSEYKLTHASAKSYGGLVVFDVLPEGGVALTKDLVQGYDESLVFCRARNWTGASFVYGGTFQITPDNAGAVAIAIDSGSQYVQTSMVCWWFSVPDSASVPQANVVLSVLALEEAILVPGASG